MIVLLLLVSLVLPSRDPGDLGAISLLYILDEKFDIGASNPGRPPIMVTDHDWPAPLVAVYGDPNEIEADGKGIFCSHATYHYYKWNAVIYLREWEITGVTYHMKIFGVVFDITKSWNREPTE
jgi:hypothetical protein